ncbi:MAG: DNA ligase D [Bosea sp. (in: a-proteobacteria)]
MPDLDLYRAKRDFSRTAEPKGDAAPAGAGGTGGVFVVHKHAARRLHYDLRLEHEGVLWSWAVTRGPSLDPDEKRLAVHVEDHPLDYGGFEGTIPEGEYGAGAVLVWDEGRWEPEGDPARGMAKGHLAFTLTGHKLAGRWHLVRLKPRKGESRDNWLLIKVDDEAARQDEDILEAQPNSVKTGRSIAEVAAGKAASSEKPAAAKAKARAVHGSRTAQRKASSAKAIPAFVEPCLATLQEHPPAGSEWLHEVKFDGYRLQARIADGKAALLTRSGLDWTARFGAPLAGALRELPCDSALIDGEVVALSDGGISSFSALQQALADEKADNLVFYAFDLLFLDGEDLRDEPLLARKERLEALLQSAPAEGPVRYSEHFVEPGQSMLRHACRMGMEGVISKRADAPYRSGRGKSWIKSKCTQRQEFVIAGYVPSQASGGGLGSILAAYYENGALKPAGRVGTGFTRRGAEALQAKLDPLRSEHSPFEGRAARERGVVWVRPELVAEIEFRAWTASKTLRHASFVALRDDKPAGEVVAEQPAAEDDAPGAGKAASKRQAKSNPKSGSKGKAETAASPKSGADSARRAVARAVTSLELSNPDKPLWPDVGLTKQGLLDYYAAVWPAMQRFVVDRPLSLLRAPDGVTKHVFFQKHGSPGMHEAILRRKDSDGEELLFIRDFDGLAALVQMGTVEIHVWGASMESIEQPDQIIFDLDPDPGVPAERVRAGAFTVRERLAELGMKSWLKSSGGKGYHVVLPLKPKADWARVKGFARDFAQALEQAEPKLYTAKLAKAARKGRIFVDYLRNGRGATAIAPYSTRARKGAPVSMPILWEELEAGIAPDAFQATPGGFPDRADAWSDFAPERSL